MIISEKYFLFRSFWYRKFGKDIVPLPQIVRTMRLKRECKVREMAGEHVVIMQGRHGVDMTRVISLNATSLYLWESLEGREFEVEDVARLLTDRYEVDASTALRDAVHWVEKLKTCELIE